MNYRACVNSLRDSFPQPSSDRKHDVNFVSSIVRALDRVDSMKSPVPMLGRPEKLDYLAAMDQRVRNATSTLEEVTDRLAEQLAGVSVVGHPLSHTNVNGVPSIAAIIGSLLPTLYNPNMVTDASARGLAVTEQTVVSMIADMVGFNPQAAGGVFTFGGTGTVLYGARIGIEKAYPGSLKSGLPPGGVLLASDQSHYCRMSVAGWLGIGEDNVIAVRTHNNNEVDVVALEQSAREAIESGNRVVCVIATMGSTDSLGIDHLQAIVEMRDSLVDQYQLDYRPHVHADAVIGWAWSAFNDYDFQANPLEFPARAKRALSAVSRRISHLALADSLGIDFHKTGFAPYISSLFMVARREDLLLLQRDAEKMPYLFNTGQQHPGTYTLETSRSGSGILAAFASLELLGRTGLQALLGHIVDVSEQLREMLSHHPTITVVNDENFGAVTLFRVYPDGVDPTATRQRERSDPNFESELRRYNDYNRRVFHEMQRQAISGGAPLISLTDCYRTSNHGVPMVAMKSYIMSPFVEREHARQLLHSVIAAQKATDGVQSCVQPLE